ncbi:hypothetical protein [Suttonella indologenes]|uniref:HTH lysR-type domain-containing protein n=1 Tax=Suttonella indologenes TaxID=13276 RepID=A0A380MZH1_9GAMM|nr:hypothetical protein [Suttonella indologenes]SUO97416.1 Uncharacterised protein [Suttonella indologenes]
MNLNALRLFVGVCQDGSLSKTAARLDVPIAIVEELKKYYGVGSPCRTICTVCGSPPCTTFSLLRL